MGTVDLFYPKMCLGREGNCFFSFAVVDFIKEKHERRGERGQISPAACALLHI